MNERLSDEQVTWYSTYFRVGMDVSLSLDNLQDHMIRAAREVRERRQQEAAIRTKHVMGECRYCDSAFDDYEPHVCTCGDPEPFCLGCIYDWPCPTIRILDGGTGTYNQLGPMIITPERRTALDALWTDGGDS